MSITHEELADIFRTVSKRLAIRPWTTGIEQAMQEVADEIEARAEDS